MNRHKKKVIMQLAGSWFRGFAAACLACYMGGINDWKIILNAGLAACLLYGWYQRLENYP